MIARIAVNLVLIGFILVGSGCAFLLPRDRERIESPWPTFDQAMEVYDEVVSGETTLEQLYDLGFDPRETPNVEELSYVDVMREMIPAGFAMTPENMGPVLRNCFEASNRCNALRADHHRINRRRFGLAILDLLYFRRQTETTGWELDATFLMVDDVVIHKHWSGNRQILKFRDQINPLGPLNDLFNFF